MPRPDISKTKAEEREEFVKVVENHIIGINNAVDVAVSKQALYYTDIRDINQAVKRLQEVITRMR